MSWRHQLLNAYIICHLTLVMFLHYLTLHKTKNMTLTSWSRNSSTLWAIFLRASDTKPSTDSHWRTSVTPWRQSVADQLVDDCVLLTRLTTWYQGHVLNWGREHSAFTVHWSGILSLSHCGLLIVSQLFVAGLRLTFLTSTYRDFIFTLLVFIIVDICTARPTRVVVGLAFNTVM